MPVYQPPDFVLGNWRTTATLLPAAHKQPQDMRIKPAAAGCNQIWEFPFTPGLCTRNVSILSLQFVNNQDWKVLLLPAEPAAL